MIRSNHQLVAVAAAASLLFVTACSGDDAATTTSAPAPDVTTAETTEPPATAAPDTVSTDTVPPDTTDVADTEPPETTEPPAPDEPTDPADIAPRPSAGCGAALAGPLEETFEGTFADFDGTYIEVLPTAHDGSTPVPLVLEFHGYSSPLFAQRALSDLGTYGEEQGFAVVLPQVTRGVPRWDAGVGSSDIAFVETLLGQILADRCIDEARIYATGMSNGAFMTSALVCQLSPRIAAAAPVAGLRSPSNCDFERPVPVIAFHGTNDTFVGYDGGFGASVANLPVEGGGTIGDGGAIDTETVPTGPSVEDMTAEWALRNGCSDEAPEESSVADDVDLLAWDCAPGSATVLYRIVDGGHTWPGGGFFGEDSPLVGRTTFSIDANELIWAFFQAHPLPTPA